MIALIFKFSTLIQHCLPLPLFLFLRDNIREHFVAALNSRPTLLLPGVPSLALLLAGYVVTQFVCISSVFRLSAECSSLTVTCVTTIRFEI